MKVSRKYMPKDEVTTFLTALVPTNPRVWNVKMALASLKKRPEVQQASISGIQATAFTAASIAAISIFFCFIISVIAAADIFLSALVVNSVNRFGYTCHDTP